MGARLTSISNFTAFTGLQQLRFAYNSLTSFPTNEITNLDFTNLELSVNELTSIDVSNLVNLQYLSLDTNELTNIDISSNDSLISAAFGSNHLTETSVNNILIQLDYNGLLNGFCYTADGTNAAPTGAGIIASNNLISKGWTVNTN